MVFELYLYHARALCFERMIQGFLSTKRALLTSLLTLTFLGVGALVTFAAPTPNSIAYQGFLTSATGTAQTGTTTVTVRLYDASTGGTLLFEELHPTTPIVNGYFSVQIGSVGDVNGSTAATSITDLLFDKSYYLTVELDTPFSTGEMTLTGGARSQLGTVPFATVAYGALQVASSTHLSTGKGKLFFNTSSNELNLYNGSSWVPVVVQGTSTSFSSLTVSGQTTLGNASSTALTATNLFATSATTSNFFSSLVSAVTAAITNLTATNATIATATVTNLAATNSTTTGRLSVVGTSTLATTTVSGTISVGTSTSETALYIQNSSGTNPFKVVSEVGSSLFSVSNAGAVAANELKVGSTTIGGGGVLGVAPSAVANYKILASGDYVYVPDHTGDNLSIVNVTDPTSPRVIAELAPGSPIDLVKSGNYIYVINYGTSVLSTYDVSDPDRPIAVTSTSTGIEPQGITLSGDKLYITSIGDNLLSVYDISNAIDPLLISTTTVSTGPYFSAISGNYAYVTGFTDNILDVVDISNPSSPVVVSNIPLSASAFQVETSDKGYTYVASYSGDIFVIDTRNPLVPTLLTTLPGSTFGRIKLSGDYLYTSSVSANALDIYDVSNPNNPKLLRSIEVPSEVYSLDVVGKYAYTSGPNGTAIISLEGVTSQTGIFDSLVARFSSFLDSFRVTGASTLSGSVIMGTSSSNPTLDSLVYIEATSSKKTLVVGSATTSLFSVDSLGKVKAKVAAIGTGLYAESTVASGGSLPTKSFSVGRYTYVSNYTDYNFSVIDTFNKEAPVVIGSVNLPGAPISLYVSGGYAYTANDYDYSLSAVDISSSTAPTVISSLVIGGGPNDLQVAGGYAYVANYSSDVVIVDVSSSTDMQIATSTATGGDFSLSTYLSGSNLFVGSRDGTVSIFDVTTPTDPLLLSTTSTGGSVGSGFAISGNISVDGTYAYVANYDASTVTVIDVSNPSAPVVGSIVPAGVNPFALTISAGYMYVVNYSDNAISVFSLSDPAVPSRVATLTSGAGPHSAEVVEGYLYVTNSSDNTLSLFNIADIAGPSATANNLEVSNVTIRNGLSLSGLTAGSVPFIGAGGRVSQDTNFFWDNTSKSLGVGTAAPTATLSVRGQVGVSAFLVEDINAVPLFSVTETGTTIVGAPSSVPNSTFVVSTVSGKDALSVLNSSGGTILSLTEAGVLRPNILELGSNGNGSSSIVINGAGLIEAGTTVIGKDYFSILSTPSTGARPADLVVVGDYVYTADRDGGGVSSINVSNKRQATTTSFVATGNYPIAIASSDDFLYVVNANDDTLSILDISSSSAPFVASTTGVGDYPIDVAARGDYVYVVSTDDRYLTVIDVSSPSSPTTMSSTLLGQDPYSISINGNYAYIGTNVGTVLVVDITDPTNPIEIVPIFPTGQGVSYVYAEDTYLYISNTNTDLMYIYDISDPNFPIAMSNIKTDAVANSGQVMVQGDFAYVIDISSGSVLVIDIRNKSLPVARARAFTAPYSERFFVKDNYLFAANQNGDQLTIVDLGGLSSVYASISTADFGKLFAKGFSSFLGGLSVGSTTSRLATLFLQSEAGKNPFVIASSSGQTILSVTQQGSLLLAATTPTSDNSKLVVQGTTTLIGSTGAPTALRVIGNIDNTATSTFTPRVVSSVGVQGGGAYDVDVEGSYAYVVNNVGNNLSIIDVSNKNSPVVISTTTVGLGGVGVIVRGKYAYVTAYDNSSFNVVDVSNARAPTVVSSLSVAGTPFGIDVSGSYAYVTRYNASGISVIDISVPDRPRVVGTVGVGTNPQAVAISGRYAYVANRGDDTVSVLDITNPASPVVVATHAVGDTPSQLTISDQYLYVANFNDGDLRVVDVANPLVPVTVATLNIGGGNIIASLDISGRYAYITNNANSFIVADISDPTSPHIVSTNSSTVGGNSYSTVVSGRYAYVTSHSDESLTVIDLGGIESTSALIHSLEAGNLSVRNDISTGGLLSVGTGLTVGSGGFLSQGNSAIYGSLTVGTSTYPNFLVNASNNTTNIGTSTGLASLFIQGTSTLNPFTVASSTGTPLFSIDTTGRVTFTNASTTNQSLSGNLYVTGQTTLTTASATALTATTIYGTAALLGTTTATFDSSKLVVQGTTTLIGTTGSPTALRVMGNIDNTAATTFNPRLISSTSTGLTPEEVVISNGYAYVANRGGSSFSIFDISSPGNPILMATSSVGSTPRSIAVYGKYVYTVSSSGGVFTVHDVTNPKSPVGVTSFYVGGHLNANPWKMLIQGGYAYVAASQDGGVYIYSLTNPANPTQVSFVSTGSGPRSMLISGKYAYVSNLFSNTLSIIDISNPVSPKVISTLSGLSSPTSISTSGRYLYLSDAGGLRLVDISDPTNPVILSTLGISFSGKSRSISGRYLIGAISDKLSIFDILNPTSPNLVGEAPFGSNPYDVAVSGRYAYVVDIVGNTLNVVDLGGLESTSALIHSLEAGNLSVRNDIQTGGVLNVGTALTVGQGGFLSQGNSAIYGSLQVGTSTYPNFLVNASNNTTNIGTSTGLASFFVQGTSTLNPFTVASSSGTSLFTILADGKVGVGTSSAYAKLDIYNGDQSTRVPSIRSFTPSGTYGHLFEVGNAGLKILSKDDGSVTFGRTDSAIGYGRLTGSSDGISFSTSLDDSTYTQRMNLSSSGVLGIGTQNQLNASTSNSLLNVAGKIVAGDHTSANGGIILEGRYGAGGALTVLGSEYSSGGPVLGYAVNPSTTTPGEFMSSYGLTSAARSAVTLSDGIKFYVQNSTTSPIGTPLSLLEAMKITSDGNIGIASSSPVFKLGVVGTFGVTDQTTLSTASATALTATTLYSSTLYGTTALLGTTTNTFDTSKLVVEGSTTLIGTAGAPTALKVIGNIDNSFAQSDWPRFITSTTTSAPGDLVVSNGFMYVISGAELSIYNVVDINNPLLISTSSANGNNIEVVGNYVYILGSSFSVVDVTDKRTPVQVGSVSYGSSYGYSVIRGQYAYVSSSVENSLKVIDINDPRQPKVVASLSVGSSPRNLAISGNVLYLVEHGAGGNLYSIDISNPLNPILLDTLGVAGGLQGVQVSNGYVYVQRFTSGGLYIVDASDPSDLSNITSIGTGSGSNDIKISGRYAYVPNYNSDTFSIIDISNPRSPQLVKNVPTSARPSAVYVDSRTLYVSNYNASQVSFYELPGIESVSALIHSLEAGNLSVRNDLSTQGMLTAGTGLTVGSGGFLSQGNSAVYGSLQVGTSTYPNFLVNTGNNTTNIGTSTGLASLFIQGTSTLNPFTVASSTGASLFTVLADGNIGVGTTSPGARFDIKAATNNSLGGLRILSSTNNNVSSRIFDGGDEGFFELLSGGSVNTLLRANGNSYLGGGNVGIGTSSPQTKLHVYGGDIFGQSAVGTANFILGNADGAANAKYSYIGGASGQTAFGRINDDLVTKSEFMRIDSSGNVGIGTSSMLGTSKLFVEGSINIPQNYALRANNNWLIGQSSSTNTINIGSTDIANDVQFDSSSGSGLFIVKSNGNIGIGSTTPFAKLSIGGFTGTGIALTPNDSATILSSFNDSTIDDLEQLRISHNLARVNIDNLRSNLNLQSYGGDVVIGTTSPSGSRLDIYHNTSATSTDMFRVISDVGSTGNVIYTIKANGDIFTDGNTTIGTPADLAENYPTSDPTITPGMVVSLASTTLSWSQSLPNGSTTDYEIAEVKKASLGTEALGVISTRPGILLGGNTTNGIPVAFSGRVPVYVSNENGIVRRGDFLTISSSTPGYAMKQTTNGQSIGRAISDQDGNSTSSLVMMIVEQKERTITVSAIEGLSLLSSSSTPPATTVRETLLARLSQGFSVVREYIAVKISAVTGYFDTVFAGEVYADTLDAQVLCLGEGQSKTCVTKEKLDSLLLLDPNNTGSNGGQTEGGSSGDTNGLTGDLGGGETVNGSTTDDGSENGTTTDIGGPSSDSNTENETPDQNQTPEGGAADVPPEEILP